MSVRSDVVNLFVNVNGDKAQNQLNELRKKANDARLAMDGLKRGTEEYAAKKKELAEINGSISNLKKEIGLTSLNQKELIQELKNLKALKGSVVPFSNEFNDLQKKIELVEKRLYDVKNGVQGFASFFSKIKDEVKQFGLMAAAYLGFEFITNQFSSIISNAGRLSDSLASIGKTTGLSKTEVKEFNKELSEIDTRTSNQQLRELGIEAGKIGVQGKDAIMEFVEAGNQINVALGEDLGEGAVKEIGKLVDIFRLKENFSLKESMLKIGSSINDVGAASSASESYLVDFLKRMGGIGPSAKISIPDLIALGGTLDSLGQTSESSSTAIGNTIGKLVTDFDGFASIAKISTEKLKQTYEDKGGLEALKLVLKGVKETGGGFDQLVAKLGDVGIEGAKAKGVFGVLANNLDMLEKQQTIANNSFDKGTSITAEYQIMNETFAATLDKVSKAFNSLISSSSVTGALQTAVNGLYNFIIFLKDLPNWIEKNKVAIVAITGVVLTYAASKIKLTTASLLSKTATFLEMAADKLEAAQKIANTVVTRAYAAAKDYLTGRITIATAAQKLWNLAMNQNPIMWAIGLITALATAYVALSSKVQQLTAAQRVQVELQKKVLDITSEEEIQAKRLFQTLQTGLLNYDQKKKLVAELIAINPKYLSGLTAENVTTLEGSKIMGEYIKNLRKANEEKARQALILDKEKQLQDKKSALSDIKVSNSDIGQTGTIKEALSYIGIGSGSALTQLKKGQDEIQKLNDELNALYNMSAQSMANEAKSANQTGEVTKVVDNTLSAEIARLEAKKKTLEAGRMALDKNDSSGNLKNLKEQEQIQKRIDFLNGKKEGKNNDANDIKNLRKRFDDLMAQLEKDVAKNTLSEMEAAFVAINLQAAKEIETVRELQSKKAISEKEANAAIDLIREKALSETKKAFEKDRAEAAKKMEGASLVVPIKPEFDIKAIEKTVTEAPNIMQRVTDAFKRNKKAAIDLAVMQSPEGSKDRLNALLIQLEAEKQEKLNNADLTENEIALIEEEYRQRKKQAIFDYYQGLTQTVITAATSINNLLNNLENKQLNKEISANERKKKGLKDQLDKKLISQKQYALEVNKLDDEMETKRKRMAHEQAKRDKKINLFGAIVSTAAGIAKALPNVPLAILTGIMGAIQIATIAATPLPELGKGDWVRTGDKHTDKSRGINALIERDEAVMNAKTMTDPNTYTVTGTPAQITSALNGMNGNGVTWAAGAVVGAPIWAKEKPKQISATMPMIMERGGIAYASTKFETQPKTLTKEEATQETNQSLSANLLTQLINEQRSFTNELRNWQREFEVKFSMKEYDRQKALYDEAKKQSSIRR